MAKVGQYEVLQGEDGLWRIYEEGYLASSVTYESKRKARIDARGVTPTAKHPDLSDGR